MNNALTPSSKPALGAWLLVLATVATGCGQLIGLDGFRAAESGGASGQGGSSGAGATAGQGGSAGTGGSAGMSGGGSTAGGTGGTSGAGGTGGTAGGPTFNCVNQGTPKRVFQPTKLDGFDTVQVKLATDQGADEIHVLASLYNSSNGNTKVLLSTMSDTGTVSAVRELDTQGSFFPKEAVVTGSVIHFQGYDNALVSMDADKTSGTPIVRSVLHDPCTDGIGNAAYYFDKTNQHMAAQCHSGDVYVDGAASPSFRASYGLRSFVIVNGVQFLTLSDVDSSLLGELRYSPSFDPQALDFGLHGPSINYLYPSTNAGEVAMFSFNGSADLSMGRYQWGTFEAATPPTSTSLPNLHTIATLAEGFFEPGHAGSEFGRLTMASSTQDKGGVRMAQLDLNGSPRIWNYEVATLSQGVVRSVDAGEMGAITSAVAWATEWDNGGTTERWVDLQIVSCLAQ